MPRSLAFGVDVKPIKGLITEFTETAFPENAAIEADNCAFYKVSTDENVAHVSTRPGLDFEMNGAFHSVPSTFASDTDVFKAFEWKNPGSDNSTLAFVVQQIGSELLVFELQGNSNEISKSAPVYTIDLEARKIAGAPSTATRYCDFTEGKGYLFVAHPYLDPFFISFDVNTSTFSVSTITIKTRDTEGLDDGLEYNYRPATLSPEHEYNLLNQAWTSGRIADVYTASAIYVSPSVYPSNADIWWMYKDLNGYFVGKLLFNEKYKNLNQPSAKGWFILDEFYKDRSAVSGVAGIPVVTAEYYRPSCVAYMGGRVFYSSPGIKEYFGKLYFSQIIEDVSYAGRCYQSNDPTSEDISDLMDTDGGVIDIGDTGVVHKLIPFGNGLLIFAEKGVWKLSGSSENGMFKPTDFSINKLSGISTLSNTSFVVANGVPFWWSSDGIYSIAIDQYGSAGVVSLTEDTIKQFYNSIYPDAKKSVKGAFDPIGSSILWYYNDNGKDRFLVYNVKLKSFSPWSIELPSDLRLRDVIGLSISKERQYQIFVSDGDGDYVTDSAGNRIVVFETTLTNAFPFIKLLTTKNNAMFTYSEFNNFTSAEDFLSDSTYTTKFRSFFTLGHRVHGKLTRKFQSNYIFVFLKNKTNSSCLLSYIWDYKRREADNPWKKYELFKEPADDRTVIMRRMKIRGKGRALSLTFENSPGKIFYMVGFGTREAIDGDSFG